MTRAEAEQARRGGGTRDEQGPGAGAANDRHTDHVQEGKEESEERARKERPIKRDDLKERRVKLHGRVQEPP
jgi:hypothetical protein